MDDQSVGKGPSGGDSLMFTLKESTEKRGKVQKKEVCGKFRSMIKRSLEKTEQSQKVKRTEKLREVLKSKRSSECKKCHEK